MNKSMLERYEEAHTLMKGVLTNKVVRNDTIFPHWISYADGTDSHCLWYQKETATGKEYRFVDIKSGSNSLAFDHKSLAQTLSNALGKIKGSADSCSTVSVIDPLNLPIRFMNMTKAEKDSPLLIHFEALDKYWLFKPDNAVIEKIEPPRRNYILSPDGKKAVFIRDHNIWCKNLASGEEGALTQDGKKDLSYASNIDGFSEAVLWSLNSQCILCTQLDNQKARSIPLVNYVPTDGNVYPEFLERKFSFPSDKNISEYRLIHIDVGTKKIQKVNYSPLPLWGYGVISNGFFDSGLGWWSADNRRAFFIDISRDSRIIRVVQWDTHTNTTRVLFEECDDIVVKLCHGVLDLPMIVPIPNTDELIWFSSRNGWGHLYLYDLNSGELKHQITGRENSANNGQWLVRDILHFDSDRRELLLQTAGRDININPYYQDICKVNIDSGTLTPLVSGEVEHIVNRPHNAHTLTYTFLNHDGLNRDVHSTGVSPSGEYLVTTRSLVNTVPESLLIDRNGREILTLETADLSDLPKSWQWPEPVKLKASDHKTDIYGVVFRPADFSPDKSYPVVDFISSMRNTCALPTGSFINTPFCGHQYLLAAALANLGFIVVHITGRGTPNRNKAFYTHHYGDQAFNSDLTDRIAGIGQLAKRYPYMDLNRVGLSANENPVNNAIYGALLHSDFYKVTVMHCMPDARFIPAAYSESIESSLPESLPPKTPYPENCIEKFDGKLLLILGMGWAQHSPTFLLADALKKANKDFDMLCIPNMHHATCAYTQRREWDYLVTHLLGEKPPKQFLLTRGQDSLG